MDERMKLIKARQRVAAMTGFYIHFAVFAVVMAILLAVNIGVSKIWWVQWPLIGWGAGVLAHGFLVFGSGTTFVQRWQQRKTKELMNKME